MYDAVNVGGFPADGDLYAGYLDGNWPNVGAVRQRFPGKPIVEIAVRTSTNAGHIFDTEPGNPDPNAAARWVAMRRASGAWYAGLYTMRSWWGWCQDALRAIGIDPATVPFWIADATGREHFLAGTVATQWRFAGSHDESIVADYWPGVDGGAPIPGPAPEEDDFDMRSDDAIRLLVADGTRLGVGNALETDEKVQLLFLRLVLDALKSDEGKQAIHDAVGEIVAGSAPSSGPLSGTWQTG